MVEKAIPHKPNERGDPEPPQLPQARVLLGRLPDVLQQAIEERVSPDRLDETLTFVWSEFVGGRGTVVIKKALKAHGIKFTQKLLAEVKREWGLSQTNIGRPPLSDTDDRIILLQELVQTATEPLNVSHLAQETGLSSFFISKYLNERGISRRTHSRHTFTKEDESTLQQADEHPAQRANTLSHAAQPLRLIPSQKDISEPVISKVIYTNDQSEDFESFVLIRQFIQEMYPKLPRSRLDSEARFTLLQLEICNYSIARRVRELREEKRDASQIKEVIKAEICAIRNGETYQYLVTDPVELHRIAGELGVELRLGPDFST